MRILGIDPGLTGGCAIYDTQTRTILDAIDIPTTGVDAKRRVDCIALVRWWNGMGPVDAGYIERAQAMPSMPGKDGKRRGMGASSSFNYGRGVGYLEAAISLSMIPMKLVESKAWKKFHGIVGSDKELSRQKVIQGHPTSASLFARKLDHGRAEAALIAIYGAALEK